MNEKRGCCKTASLRLYKDKSEFSGALLRFFFLVFFLYFSLELLVLCFDFV